jgi:predicted nucleic acid-binding protein
VIYLDTSALAKLLRQEPETAALGAWLGERMELPWVTSVVGRTELMRVSGVFPAVTLSAVGVLVGGLNLVPLTDEIVQSAGTVGPPALRSLDAVHLASALSVADELTTVCCYDQRLAQAAAEHGLALAAPQ